VRQPRQVVGEQRDLGRLDGHVGAPTAHRHPNVGHGQGRSVVHAIAHEAAVDGTTMLRARR
jgi:hypothetical protein